MNSILRISYFNSIGALIKVMKNIKNQYTYKNNKWLITTAMITLTIFNIKPVQAETDIENGEEINAIEEQNENQSLENSTKNDDMTDEETLEEESSKEFLSNYSEVIENIIPLLDTEQEQAFNDFLSKENETTKLFKEIVSVHHLNEFTQANELYEELLDSLSERSNNYIVDL